MEIKYAIKHIEKNEYLREGFESGDAYTDDLGNAKIFECIHSAKNECSENEKIVAIEVDEEGYLYEQV